MTAAGNVAIDGPVASGKSTVALGVARRLGTLYLDTGAMYRALTLSALRAGVATSDEPGLVLLLHAKPIEVALERDSPLGFWIRTGGVDVTKDLFSQPVTAVVSEVSAHPAVRAEMVTLQRAIAQRGPVVMAGRDIGTVVLPDAPIKIFLTASVEARVGRRAAELAAAGTSIEGARLRAQIEERDRLDEERPVGALRPALGATIIDSSELTSEEVVERIVGLVTAGAAHH